MKRKKYLYPDTDRHGNQRHYFKPPGHKNTRIRFAPGTEEANQEYERLFRLYEAGELKQTDKPAVKDSLEWLFRQFEASSEFQSKAENTQLQRSNFYRRLSRVHGHIPYLELTDRNLADIRDSLGPGAGRNMLKAVSAAYTWACRPEVGLATSNPTKGVVRPSQKTMGHIKWTLDEVLQFKNHYPKGSNPRKCLAMLLFTSREISGVRTLGRGDVRDGLLRGYRQKTWAENPIPVMPLLREELGADYDDMVWLRASHGGPYSSKSLSQKFSAWATDAGLPHLSAHGLRKSVATILAELGMSERTLMATLAHRDPRQAQVYVQDAENRHLAKAGMDAVQRHVSARWNEK